MANTKIPSYRRQRSRNHDRAFVELNGVRRYLGGYGTPESRELYERVIGEWIASGRHSRTAVVSEITIIELVADYWVHAEAYYRKPDGQPTSEVENIRLALKPLRALYGSMRAAAFGPKALKAVREKMIEQGGSRKYINRHMGRIKRMFKWGVGEELVPPSVFHGLQAIPGLKRGRTSARETDPIRPVPESLVETVRPFLSRQVKALVDLQVLTGARCGELFSMRPIDIDMNGAVWQYKPVHHKTAHQGRDRVIYLGPKAQAVLRPFLTDRALDVHMFSPREADKERRLALHQTRKTPLSCGNRPGTHRQRQPERSPHNCYGRDAYRRAIARACDRAFPPPKELSAENRRSWQKDHRWHPHQLRHTAATRLRKEFGLEAAQVILGHACADVTQVYAERDTAKAIDVACRVG